MKSRFALSAIIVAAILFLAGCDEYPSWGQQSLSVSIVSGTDHAEPCRTACFVVTSKAANCEPSFRYVMDWGDSTTSTSDLHSPGDTWVIKHPWRYPGRYEIRATAKIDGDSSSVSVKPSVHQTVVVWSDSYPIIDSAQLRAQQHPPALLAFAHNLSGDSTRLAVAWGDGRSETTAFQSSPCQFNLTHIFVTNGDVKVVLKALGRSGTASAPETLTASIGAIGGVVWLWQGVCSGSPIVVGQSVYVLGPDGVYCLGDSPFPNAYPGFFSGSPSFSSQTDHIYIGAEDGLYALTPALHLAWRYPSSPESLTGVTWGGAAVKGNALYAPCSNDTVYCFVDSATSATRAAAFSAAQVDAVALDASGSVYFGSDSGYLYKLTPGLDLVWRAQLQSGGRVFGPVIGADGTIYCTSDSNRAFAVNPDDGTGKWTALLNAPSYRPVVGADGLYACSSNGYLSKLSLNTGAVVWVKTGLAFASSAPVLVAGGYLYVQTEDDRLYYLTQASGDSVWVCNCGDYLPHRRAIFPADISSPTVDTDGNVYVVGTEAVYKITANSPLDASVPWPKWQHDLYNTGYVRGGR